MSADLDNQRGKSIDGSNPTMSQIIQKMDIAIATKFGFLKNIKHIIMKLKEAITLKIVETAYQKFCIREVSNFLIH